MTEHLELEWEWKKDCPKCGTEYDAEEWDDVERSDAGGVCCADCYVNEACPAECNGDHEPPDPYFGLFTCETTGQVFIPVDGSYVGDDEWEEAGRYPVTSTEVHDRWYQYPYDHGYACCNDCNEWTYEDEVRYDEDGDYGYCESCWEYNGHGRGARADGSRDLRCTNCRAAIGRRVFFDTTTDAVFCAEHNPGHHHIRELEAA